ncbi:hypothetical protein ACYOEI_10225 [Singulisphaera rosea]
MIRSFLRISSSTAPPESFGKSDLYVSVSFGLARQAQSIDDA